MRRHCAHTERRKISASIASWHRIRDIDDSLCGLAGGDRCHHLLQLCVDGADRIAVLDADVHPRTVPLWPDPMGKRAGGNRCDALECIGPEYLNDTEST